MPLQALIKKIQKHSPRLWNRHSISVKNPLDKRQYFSVKSGTFLNLLKIMSTETQNFRGRLEKITQEKRAEMQKWIESELECDSSELTTMLGHNLVFVIGETRNTLSKIAFLSTALVDELWCKKEKEYKKYMTGRQNIIQNDVLDRMEKSSVEEVTSYIEVCDAIAALNELMEGGVTEEYTRETEEKLKKDEVDQEISDIILHTMTMALQYFEKQP